MALRHGFAVTAYRLREYAPQRTDDGVVPYGEFALEEQCSNTKLSAIRKTA